MTSILSLDVYIDLIIIKNQLAKYSPKRSPYEDYITILDRCMSHLKRINTEVEALGKETLLKYRHHVILLFNSATIRACQGDKKLLIIYMADMIRFLLSEAETGEDYDNVAIVNIPILLNTLEKANSLLYE